MKKTALTLVALFALASVSAAGTVGSSFGSLTTAQTVEKGKTSLGGQIGLAEATSFVGALTYGLSENADVRVKIASLDRSSFETGLAFGADVKLRMGQDKNSSKSAKASRKSKSRRSKSSAKRAGAKNPVDMAIGGFFEYASLDVSGIPLVVQSQSVFQIGAQFLLSKTSHLKGGGTLTPYGKLNARHESVSADLVAGAPTTLDLSDSKLALGLNSGLAWGMANGVKLFGEFQLDGNDGFFFGADFNF